MRSSLVLLLLVLGAAVPTTCPAAPATADLGVGQTLRLQLRDGTTLEGTFAGWKQDSLRVVVPADRLNESAGGQIVALWKRERQTGHGLRLGAALGAIGGAGLFTMAALILQEIGEGEDDVSVGRAALLGGLLGAAGGGLLGTVTGSAIPRWQKVSLPPGEMVAVRLELETPAPATASALLSPRPRGLTGSLGFLAGLGWGEGHDLSRGGLGGTLGLLAEFPCGLAIGPEVGWFHVGGQEGPRYYQPPPGYVYDSDQRVWFGGGVLRYAPPWSFRPYVLASLGGYNWEDGFLGGSLGAGVEADLMHSRLALDVQYRRHDNLQNLVDVDPGFSTLAAGLRWNW